MIVVLGSVQVQEGKLQEALTLSQEHVLRSREEPGCIEHGVSQNAENAGRLVFVERWDSMQSLQAHFAVPASRSFAKELAELASAPATMALYEASQIAPSGKRAA
ncbi:putative quinol monooxygenase [Hydrogenophaga sp. RWCD_12]|uniref:putative quinol monooxygenase n=1 Tax=Hydrogenophaga sp. RWCD_12 TaxID=3391190 RepID=UPI003985307F